MKDTAAILATCPTALLVVDAQGHVQAHNPALLALTGLSASDLADPTLATLRTLDGDALWTRPDGQDLPLRVLHSPLEGGGEALWIQDLSESQGLREELRAQSLTDAHTGLFNTRGVTLALEPQVARSRRYSSPMAVIMMEAGAEPASAETQRVVARLLKDQLRWADIIGCSEQGEFILVLPETSRDDALKLADKLSAHLRGPDGDSVPELWPCYGVTEWRKSDSATTLLQRAASALQQARDAQQGMAVAL
ncbi:MAG TPA: PAS domain-containing protein [Gammaproteobacteria bacterium]